MDSSECVWFLEPFTAPQQHQQQHLQQDQRQSAAKQLTVVLEKHRGAARGPVAQGGGAHWGGVFEETAAEEAATAAYAPVLESGNRQPSPLADGRSALRLHDLCSKFRVQGLKGSALMLPNKMCILVAGHRGQS